MRCNASDEKMIQSTVLLAGASAFFPHHLTKARFPYSVLGATAPNRPPTVPPPPFGITAEGETRSVAALRSGGPLSESHPQGVRAALLGDRPTPSLGIPEADSTRLDSEAAVEIKFLACQKLIEDKAEGDDGSEE